MKQGTNDYSSVKSAGLLQNGLSSLLYLLIQGGECLTDNYIEINKVNFFWNAVVIMATELKCVFCAQGCWCRFVGFG